MTVVAASPSACGDELLALDFEPAWNGVAEEYGTTEISVYLSAGITGDLALTVTDPADPNKVSVHRFVVDEGEPVTRTIPIQLASTGTIKIVATLAGRNIGHRQMDFDLVSGPRIAVTADMLDLLQAWPARGVSMQVTQLAPEKLPRFGSSYAGLDLLVADASTISRLSHPQRTALQVYLTGCGRAIVLIEADKAQDELWQEACREAVLFRSSSRGLAQAANRMLMTDPNAIVGYRQLERFFTEPPPNSLLAVTGYLAVYFCLALLALWKLPVVAGTLYLPLAGAGLVLLIWNGGEGDVERLIWSEARTGAGVARTTEIGRLVGQRRVHAKLQVPFEPLLHAEFGIAARDYDHDTELMTVVLRVPLLSVSSYRLTGRSEIVSPPVLRLRGEPPGVANMGPETGPRASLAWNDGVVQIPVLAAGSEWQVGAEEPTGWSDSAIHQLLRTRAMIEQPVLLLPGTLPLSQVSVARQHGFLAIGL